MANPENIKGHEWKKGQSGNPNGRPKGKRLELRRLINDLKFEYRHNGVTPLMKKMIYDLYNISLSDYDLDGLCSLSTSDKHLYFLKSEMIGGLKVGVSKNIERRIKQIRSYAPDASLIKYIPYCSEFETKIHRKFDRLNIKSEIIGVEWFSYSSEMIDWINNVNTINDLVREFGANQTKKISVQHQLQIQYLNAPCLDIINATSRKY